MFCNSSIATSGTSSAAYRAKVVLVGESTVGKTSLLKYFVEGEASPRGMPTFGVEFRKKLCTQKIEDRDEELQVQIWDTAGQERFRTITPNFFKSAISPNGQPTPVAVVICYDLTNTKTFQESVNYWLTEAREHAAPNSVICLVGNKVDLAKAGGRAVTREEGEEIAKAKSVDFFFETSARTGEAVEEMFLKVLDKTLARSVKAEKEGPFDLAKVTSVSLPPASIETREGVTFFRLDVLTGGTIPSRSVYRRYNDFVQLKSNLGEFPTAPFPRKHMTGCSGAKLDARRQGLESWLSSVLKGRKVRSPANIARIATFLEKDRQQAATGVPGYDPI